MSVYYLWYSNVINAAKRLLNGVYFRLACADKLLPVGETEGADLLAVLAAFMLT